MRNLIGRFLFPRALAVLIMTAVIGISVPITASAALAVDVKANGQDALTLTSTTTSFTITLDTTDAVTCTQTSPVVTGVATSLNMTINFGMPDYPAEGGSTIFTVECEDSLGNFLTDSVVVNLSTPAPLALDLTVNGSNGPVTINSGDSYTFAWTSTSATTCDQTSPVSTGLSLSGSSTVNSGDPDFYPTVGAPITISITCSDGATSVTDSVVVNLSTGGGGSLTLDLTVNGSNGPVTINSGDSYTFAWTSTNATICDQTSPVATGVSLTGTSTVNPGDPDFYPTAGTPVTISISCTDGSANVTDSVVVSLSTGGGGGGGGGSSGGGGGGGGGGSSRSSASFAVQCPWINSYMRVDLQNDPIEVMKLQSFLKVFMGYDYVEINGVFDSATYTAVGAFQTLYSEEILAPWGHTAPTHYVYILTLKKINEIYCQNISPLTPDQLAEITAFRIALEEARQAEVPVSFTPEGEIPTEATTTPIELPIVGSADPQGQNLRALTAAIFSLPDNIKDTLWTIYELILILIVLYALGTVLKDVLYEDLPMNNNKRFMVKWGTIFIGLLGAFVLSLIFGKFALILPLFIGLVLSLGWIVYTLKGKSIRASLKAWLLVLKAKFRSSTPHLS